MKSSEFGKTTIELLEQLDFEACGIVGTIDGLALSAEYQQFLELRNSLNKLKEDFIKYALKQSLN